MIVFKLDQDIEYEIFGEGSHTSTNQKRESTLFSLLIGRNMRPFPENFVLYKPEKSFSDVSATSSEFFDIMLAVGVCFFSILGIIGNCIAVRFFQICILFFAFHGVSAYRYK